MSIPDILCVSVIGLAFMSFILNIILSALAKKPMLDDDPDVLRIDKINGITIAVGLLLMIVTSVISAFAGAWQNFGFAVSVFLLSFFLFSGFLLKTLFNKEIIW